MKKELGQIPRKELLRIKGGSSIDEVNKGMKLNRSLLISKENEASVELK